MLDKFAKLIGIEPRLAEDALHSERAARHVLTRRGFMGGVAAAMAGAAVFSIPIETEAAELIIPKPSFKYLGRGASGMIWASSQPTYIGIGAGAGMVLREDGVWVPWPREHR